MIHQQLAAGVEERLQVRIGAIDDAVVDLQRARQIGRSDGTPASPIRGS